MGSHYRRTAMIQDNDERPKTVNSWLDAGKSEDANAYIHPAGGQPDDAYWSSGRDDARIIELIKIARI